jgi:molybdopterin-containing oxidoreductase family membrane subunit
MYIHPTGGRAIISIPPFLIITYELTILCGILATVVGFVLSARLPAFKNRVYVPEVSVDKFAVSVVCEDPERLKCAREILQNTGAEEIREVEGAQ